MINNLKIVELASVLAGPDVGMFFAELGAQVIKIENKLTNGDVTRKWKLANEQKDTNVSAYFSSVNYKKKYLQLNLTDASDKTTAYKLIGEADIVICNFKYGDDVKLGFDYTTIKKINSHIIYACITGFGNKSKKPAFDVVLQAETGFMYMNGTPNSGPVKMPVALIDVLAAHQLKEGILVALLLKKQGVKVEVSLYDAAIASLKNQATNWLMNKHIPKPIGSLHPNISPYGEIFTTKDNKLIVLAIGSDKQFSNMLKVIGASAITTKPEYNNNQQRVIHRVELYKELQPYFAKLNSSTLTTSFEDKDVPAGIIKSLNEVFEDKNAQKLVVEEHIENILTKRVKTVIFRITEV